MAVENHPSERLLSLNDPLLHPLIDAHDDAARRIALETVLVEVAAPTIRKAMASFARAEGGLQPADADDVAATVTLRLVKRLSGCATFEEQAIERLPDYIATQTFNAIHDLLRARFPERMRLKNRIRYVLTHDPRLALWTSPFGVAAGLARDRDSAPQSEITLTPTRAMLDRDRPADAIFAILSHVNGPIRLETLVRKVAELWNVTDTAPRAVAALTIGDDKPSAHDRIEARQTLEILWSEITALRAPQRAALLLNLRDIEGANGIVVFLLANVATFEQIAEALEMTPQQLAEIWSDLPLDDLRIGERLGLKRQQVINLRQAARDRLSRRMFRGPRR